ncbi:BamA/TamA family outer membrane protein [Haliea sp. E17]|uniref:BamA/TamA family outer membrane protein n=1 Tax=Haliea sp. E17 TaxID=3401576 RepID=UPI003AAE1921
MKKYFPLVIAGILGAAIAQADFSGDYLTDPEDGNVDVSRFLTDVPLGFLPIPNLITEPAVGTGLSLGALFFHESAEQRQQRTAHQAMLPANITLAGGAYTENGTWGAGLGQLGFWRRDTIRYRGFLAYVSPNLDFYSFPGIGNLPRPIELNLEGPIVFQDIKFRVPDTRIFVGARQLYRKVEASLASSPDLSALPPPILDYFRTHLKTSFTTSGLGAVIDYDSRDNPFNPQHGYYYSANYTIFDGSIGSDVDYDSYQLSGLNFWELGDKWNLGLRLDLEGVEAPGGERLPPYVPPFIDMRGIPKSRYQGTAIAVTEVQLDYKLSYRWKVGVFTGLGRAANSWGDISNADNVDSYGTGFRYLIARRYGFVMGIDVARGPEDTAVYIQAGSTW